MADTTDSTLVKACHIKAERKDIMIAERKELHELLEDANQAKDRLARLAEKLEEAGYHRKAKSCMGLVYAIEEWQNRK
jgi:hypothetical protein